MVQVVLHEYKKKERGEMDERVSHACFSTVVQGDVSI